MKDNQDKNTKITSILFTAPRYHTNQIPIVKGLQEKGIDVSYLVQYVGVVEDHTLLTPLLFKENLVSRCIKKVIQMTRKKSNLESLSRKMFIPSFFHTVKQIRKINPDVVVMRNRSNISLIVTLACRCLGKKNLVLYTQTPLNSTSKLSLKKKIFYHFFPTVRMTPILKHRNYEEQYPSCKRWPHDYYVPLIFPVSSREEKKQFMQDGIIHILCIGKYRAYKNHEILVEAVSQLTKQEQQKIHITIVGQNSVPNEHEYYHNLKLLIHQLEVDTVFDLQMNRSYALMQELYDNNDVLILPSKLETAGMVILEAMGNGLCTIASDNCGLSSYILDAQGGYNFDYKSALSLTQILQELIAKPDKICKSGDNGRQFVQETLSFESYFVQFEKLLQKEFKVSF